MARCTIHHIRLILKKGGFCGFVVVVVFKCMCKSEYVLWHGASFSFQTSRRRACKILCEHPVLQALKPQLVLRVICMLILLLFSICPTSFVQRWSCSCAGKLSVVSALPFSIGFSWTTKVFWDKWHSKRVWSWFLHIPSNPEIVMNHSHSWITHCYS